VIIAQGNYDQIDAIYNESMAIVGNYPDDAFSEIIREELELVRDELTMDEQNTTT
jgi:hypothetical protein